MRMFFLVFIFCLTLTGNSFARITEEEYKQVISYLEQGMYSEGIDAIQSSLKTDPDQATLYNLLGMIYLKQNESIQSAIGSFEEAIRLNPTFTEAYFNLASVYSGPANRPELAAVYLKKTLELNPNYTQAYFGLGWLSLMTDENPYKAEEYFEKVIEQFPNLAEAYQGLGLSYIQMRKPERVLEIVSKLRELGREDQAASLESILRGGNPPSSEPSILSPQTALVGVGGGTLAQEYQQTITPSPQQQTAQQKSSSLPQQRVSSNQAANVSPQKPLPPIAQAIQKTRQQPS